MPTSMPCSAARIVAFTCWRLEKRGGGSWRVIDSVDGSMGRIGVVCERYR